MKYTNEMTLTFDAISQNEAFARMVAAAFVSQLNPTIAGLTDVKTAVSEAVTNSIIHAYNEKGGKVTLYGKISGNDLTFEVTDEGCGIADIKQAIEPLYTSKPGLERSGMGFTVMESFMDSMEVNSEPGKGTTVILRKNFADENADVIFTYEK